MTGTIPFVSSLSLDSPLPPEVGVLVAAENGEITRLGLKYESSSVPGGQARFGDGGELTLLAACLCAARYGAAFLKASIGDSWWDVARNTVRPVLVGGDIPTVLPVTRP